MQPITAVYLVCCPNIPFQPKQATLELTHPDLQIFFPPSKSDNTDSENGGGCEHSQLLSPFQFIIHQINDKNIFRSYSLPDGTKRSQSIHYTTRVTCPGYVMTGSWEYIGPDGKLYRTEFTADNEGYKPRWGSEKYFQNFLRYLLLIQKLFNVLCHQNC